MSAVKKKRFRPSEEHPKDIEGVWRYVLYVVEDGKPLALIDHRPSGSATYMAYKTIAGARRGQRRVHPEYMLPYIWDKKTGRRWENPYLANA